MTLTVAPSSWALARRVCAPRAGSMINASRVASSTTRYALSSRGGRRNDSTIMYGSGQARPRHKGADVGLSLHQGAVFPDVHDVLRGGEDADVREGILRDGDHVCVEPLPELSGARRLGSEGPGAVRGRGLDRLERAHAGLDKVDELVRVHPPGRHAFGAGHPDVRAQGDPDAFPDRARERLPVLALDRADLRLRVLRDA